MTLNRFAILALALFLGTAGLSSMARASGVPQGPPLPGYGQDRGGWDAPPQELQELQRRGFHDGIEAARNDFNNQRRPDVNRREEFRHPRVPRDDRDAYRDGFRRGYDTAISHLSHGPEQQMPQPGQQMRMPEPGGRDMGPEQGTDIHRRGFHDGMEAGRSDLESQRRPNAGRHNEYRHPPVPREARDEYREGFQRGYERAFSQQMGGPDRR
jgi:hypothetical protein